MNRLVSHSSQSPTMKISSVVAACFLVRSTAAFAQLPTAGRGLAGLHLFNQLFSTASSDTKFPIMAEESVMSQKAHGTSDKPVQKDLRWKCDFDTADRICNFNRHYAEFAGYWQTTEFVQWAQQQKDPIQFYDSVTGALLFTAPIGRTMNEFLVESQKHGWPSFRDEEVNWEYVRCLKDGECVSTTGTHLGHNIPDKSGNRYCINLVSVAGQPDEKEL